MASEFEKALSARPSDPKDLAAARARFRIRVFRDGNLSVTAVRLAGLIETAFLNASTGVAWPGYAALCRDLGCDRRTVSRAVQSLVTAGHVVVCSGNQRTSNRYTLPWSSLLADDGPRGSDAPRGMETTRGEDADTLGAAAPPPRGSGVHTLGAAAPPEHVEKNLLNEPVERTGREPDPVLLAVDAYNSMAERAGLSRCQKVSPGRRSAIRARLKDAGGLEGWQVALEKVEASDFLTGGGSSGWRANIDYIASASRFLKIMEGQHDDGPSRRGGDSKDVAGQYIGRQPKRSDKLAAVSEVFDAVRQRQGE